MDIHGNMQTALWRPKLIRLTAADSSSSVADTPVYVDPHYIYHIRRIPIDKEGILKEEVTYIHIAGTGVYVRESPDEVFRLRELAMIGEESTHLKVV